EQMVRKLESAVALSPEFFAARSALGVEYMRMGRDQEALDQFEKALAAGGRAPGLFRNFRPCSFKLGRRAEGAPAARRALSLESGYGRAHYLLGSVLGRGVGPDALENAPEAAHHLRLGASEVPHALVEIAQIYLFEGDRPSAAALMRLYLQTGDRV